jgi:hypothetical protein
LELDEREEKEFLKGHFGWDLRFDFGILEWVLPFVEHTWVGIVVEEVGQFVEVVGVLVEEHSVVVEVEVGSK